MTRSSLPVTMKIGQVMRVGDALQATASRRGVAPPPGCAVAAHAERLARQLGQRVPASPQS